MKRNITIVAEPREGRGKNEARRLRAGGRIPAVVYGAGSDATAVSVDPKMIDKILFSNTGHNTIFDLELDGEGAKPAMIVDWQHDPIKDRLLHVDLSRIDLKKKLMVKVPVHTQGDPKGVKQQGGLMEIVTREIEIECLPDDIPEHFTVDVTELLIGQNIRAADVTLGDSMALTSNPNTVICHVVALRAAETTETAEAAPEAEAVAKPEDEKEKKEKEKE